MTFKWTATLNDETVIRQINGDVETPFSEIQDNIDELKLFRIEDDAGEYYEVNFTTNELDCNGKVIKTDLTEKDSCSLIYSRRNQIRMGVGETQEILDSRVTHRIGLESGDYFIVAEILPSSDTYEGSKVIKQRINGVDVEEDIVELWN